MESFPVDFDVRERVVDGHTFGVRVIPVGKLDALEAPIVQIVAQASLAVRAEMSDDEKREALTKALDPHLAALSEAYAELVRWGIVSMDGKIEEHTSELQSHHDLVCRLLLEKKKK